jgi:hypothetical protein
MRIQTGNPLAYSTQRGQEGNSMGVREGYERHIKLTYQANIRRLSAVKP